MNSSRPENEEFLASIHGVEIYRYADRMTLYLPDGNVRSMTPAALREIAQVMIQEAAWVESSDAPRHPAPTEGKS